MWQCGSVADAKQVEARAWGIYCLPFGRRESFWGGERGRCESDARLVQRRENWGLLFILITFIEDQERKVFDSNSLDMLHTCFDVGGRNLY